jgi:hypothetical protein
VDWLVWFGLVLIMRMAVAQKNITLTLSVCVSFNDGVSTAGVIYHLLS